MAVNGHPLVTIGIPTHNRADSYLRKTLTSALNQTYQNVEIIVSDNCSTDSTEPFIRGLSDPRIRYFKHTNNIGANNNFNFCLAEAKGDYFLLLHDDDLIDDDFIDVCMSAANYQTDIGIIRAGMRRIDTRGKAIGKTPNLVGGLSTVDFFLGWFSGKTPMHLCSTLFNTKRLREIGGFRSKRELFQDVIAEVQLSARFGRADVQDIKASFRNHPFQNTNSVKIKAWCEDSLFLLDIICELVPENKALVRSRGSLFFTKHNYNLACRIESPIDRFFAYIVVFKMFDYPIHFFIQRLKGEMRKGLKKALKGSA